MSRGLSTPNIAILGCGDLAARIEGSPPAFAHANIQEPSQTRLSPFFPVSLCGITLLVIYSLRAEQAAGRRSGNWFADRGKEFRCIRRKMTFSLVYLRTGVGNKSVVLGEK